MRGVRSFKIIIVTSLLGQGLVWAGSTQRVEDELKMSAHDEAGNEVKALKAELLISKNEEKALQQLKKLLAKHKGSPLEPSLHFRLAELYVRRSKTANFFEVHRDENKVIQFSPMATKSQSSRQWITKAVETYDLIQRKFIHFRDMDLVLFNNAFSRQILGQDKAAMVLYKKVIEDYNESPLIPDCHLAIGESLFNAKKYQDAFNEFEKIRKYPDSKVHSYGLYKGAWALYNLRKNEEGLKQLEEVVAASKIQREDDNGSRLDLLREALEDMVVFYEDIKRASDAVSYFKKQAGESQYGPLILKLGRIYQRHGKLSHLEILYTGLISETPLVAERPFLHKDLIESFETRNMRDKAVLELEKISDLCKAQSNWAKVQKPDTQKECFDVLTETAKNYASKWHKEYSRIKLPLLGNYTRRAYESLLISGKSFEDEDKARYSYAELLFNLEDYRKAVSQYSLAAFMTKDAKMKHDSSYAALVSLEKDIKEKWSDSDEELFAKLSADYIKYNPKGQHLTEVKFKKAFIAYEKGKYERAAPELRELALNFTGNERGKKAAQLYLDILNIQKRFELLKDEALMFSKKQGFENTDKESFNKIYQQAYFTLVQNLENEKKYAQATKVYSQFVKDNPKSLLADKALLNAVRCAQLAGDLPQAAELSEQFLKEHPQAEQSKEVSRNLVTLYETQAQLGMAGKILLRLSETDDEKRLQYLLNGADYKALNNEWGQALQLYTMLAKKYPDSKEGKVATERMLTLSEKNGQKEQTDKLLEQIESMGMEPQSSIASFKITKKICDQKEDENCFKLTKKVLNHRSDKNASKWALAQTRLLQGKILEKEFEMTSIKAKPERLALVLKIKMEKLERVQKAYQDVMSYGDKQTAIEALVKLAGVYGKFSTSIREIKAPDELSEADKIKFLNEMENFAIPLEERTADTLQIALRQAKDMKLHDGSVAVIQDELNKLSRKKSRTKLVMDIVMPENALPKVN